MIKNLISLIKQFRRLVFLYSNLKLKFTNLTVNLEVKQQGEVSRDDFSSFEAKLSVR